MFERDLLIHRHSGKMSDKLQGYRNAVKHVLPLCRLILTR